jgi:hypothetical protein
MSKKTNEVLDGNVSNGQFDMFETGKVINQVKLDDVGKKIGGIFLGVDVIESIDEKSAELKTLYILHFQDIDDPSRVYTCVANFQMLDFINKFDFQPGYFLEFTFIRQISGKRGNIIKEMLPRWDKKGCRKERGLLSLDDVKKSFESEQTRRRDMKIASLQKQLVSEKSNL